MKLSQPVNGGVLDFDPYNVRSQADPSHDFGALVELDDMRAFRYGKAGASNVSVGKVQLAPAPKTNHTNNAVTAAVAAGANQVPITLAGATAAVVGEYDDGYLIVNAGPGIGQVLKISHNPAISGSGSGTIALVDAVVVALTTSSKVTLVHNAYNGVVEAAAATRRSAGVPLVSLTATYNGWLQTKGVASVLADGTIAVGNDLIASSAVAGAAKVVDTTSAATATAQSKIGQANIVAGVDTEYRPVVLSID